MKEMLSLLLLFVCSAAIAHIRLDFPFANGMVLQRNQPVTLSGKAAAGETIQIVYFKKKCTTQTSLDGKWSVALSLG